MASGFAFFTIMRAARKLCRRTAGDFSAADRSARRDRWFGRNEASLREPEMRNLREHLALARNAVGHDDVEGGNAVAGDEQQAVAEVEYLADLAAPDFFDARQIELQNRFVCHARIIKFPVPKFKVQSRQLERELLVRLPRQPWTIADRLSALLTPGRAG